MIEHRITTSGHEFTIDFARLDPTAALPTGILVARVALSSHAFEDLRRSMESTWAEYHRRVLPPEVDDDAR